MYRTVDARFWSDPKVRQLPPQGKLLLLYLLSNPHSHLSGVYSLPLVYVTTETRIQPGAAKRGLRHLGELGIAHYDAPTETVWVVKMMRYQGRGEKHVISAAKQIESLHPSKLIAQYLKTYSDVSEVLKGRGFNLNLYPFDTPSMGDAPVATQDQDQDQDQNPPTPHRGNGALPGFDKFWLIWRDTGRRTYKRQAAEVWRNRKLEEHADGICQRLMAQIEYKAQCDNASKFCPEFQDPHRWLKNSRWNDEVTDA